MAVAMAVGMAGAMATDTAIRTTGTARTAAGGGPYGYGCSCRTGCQEQVSPNLRQSTALSVRNTCESAQGCVDSLLDKGGTRNWFQCAQNVAFIATCLVTTIHGPSFPAGSQRVLIDPYRLPGNTIEDTGLCASLVHIRSKTRRYLTAQCLAILPAFRPRVGVID